jgi:hypothetical protein
VDSVTYFHIQLAEHAVILAEGLPVENYLDTGDRSSFADAAVKQLHPDFGAERRDAAFLRDALACAPLSITGREIELVRARLARLPARRVAKSAAASRR